MQWLKGVYHNEVIGSGPVRGGKDEQKREKSTFKRGTETCRRGCRSSRRDSSKTLSRSFRKGRVNKREPQKPGGTERLAQNKRDPL